MELQRIAVTLCYLCELLLETDLLFGALCESCKDLSMSHTRQTALILSHNLVLKHHHLNLNPMHLIIGSNSALLNTSHSICLVHVNEGAFVKFQKEETISLLSCSLLEGWIVFDVQLGFIKMARKPSPLRN